MRTTVFWLLMLAEVGSLGFGFWFLFADEKPFLGAAFLAAALILSAIIQRMTRYLVKIQAANKAIKQGDFRGAEKHLLDAAKLATKFKSTDPRLAALWNLLGALYLDDAEYAAAERCLREARTARRGGCERDRHESAERCRRLPPDPRI